MLKRIFKLVVAVDLPGGTKHTLVYELDKPVPKVPGEPEDNIVVAHMDYEETFDEEGDLTGMYRVILRPPEGSDLHMLGISVMIEHSINDVLRVYDAIALMDVSTVIKNFETAYKDALEKGSEEIQNAAKPKVEPQGEQADEAEEDTAAPV
jgi:hypothetical protein